MISPSSKSSSSVSSSSSLLPHQSFNPSPSSSSSFFMGYLSCNAHSSISVSDSHRGGAAASTASHHANLQQFNYRDLELATDHFSDDKLLGRGSHGLVYKALLPSGRLVAVKRPSRRRAPNFAAAEPPANEFDNEIHILSHVYSPRFVNLVGFTSDSNTDKLMVVEYMSNGTLYDFLHNNPKPPNWSRRIKLGFQIAKAIETLHSQFPPVIHRDIKSANVLIDRNSDARLADFGLALRCYGDDIKLRSTPPAGTMGYLDPGYVTPDNLSTKTDVFSFGILLLEIISGRKAIDVGFSPPSIIDWAIPLIRKGKLFEVFDPRVSPPKDPIVRKQLAVIAAKCVRSCRERRPSMKEVVKGLDVLTKLVPLSSWNGFGNPCLMVDDVGMDSHSGSRMRRFECGNPNDVDSRVSRPLRDSKRVYSDLGFRNNLKDLLAEPDDESDQLKIGRPCSSFRISSERFGDRGSNRLIARASILHFRRNQ